MQISGWLFDAYPCASGMTLWLLDEAGDMHSCTAVYYPSFYLTGNLNLLKRAQNWFQKASIPLQAEFVEKREFYSNDWVPALEVQLLNPLHYVPLTQRVLRQMRELEPATCDIPLSQLFFISTGLFPLCRLEATIDGRGQLEEFQRLDSPEDTEYSYPPLRTLALRVEGENYNPAHGRKSPLLADFDGHKILLEEETIIDEINRIVKNYDPHLVLTEWGDSFLIPQLLQLAKREKKKMRWDRDPQGKLQGLKGRSYFTYGKVVYVAPEIDFRGRWHIDRINSFIVHESGLEGLFELARLSKIPIQRVARVSTGTCISAMQLDVAIRENYLIPYRKHQAEEFKTAEELLIIDKGGLTYQPVLGIHENVAELDFASMYPTIMTQFNLSPETLNCTCCPDAPRIPETRYRICQKRLGLIPKTLTMVLGKRVYYKRQKKYDLDLVKRGIADRKQCALKWLLVTCFGYLGYKNARFGKIEAHESTTAMGREMLLKAKEYIEDRDFQLIHALTDSLWIHKPGTSAGDYEQLARDLSEALTIPISFEGTFRWINFVPSRQNPEKPVPNRYFGVYENRELKLRGIEARRSDSPRFIQRVQKQMLAVLQECKTVEECRQQIPSVLNLLATALDQLSSGQVAFEELVVNRRLSQDPLTYEKANISAIASQQLLSRGIQLAPGERIQLVYLNARSRIPAEKVRAYSLLDDNCSYDVNKYSELLLQATEALLLHFGWNTKKLDETLRLMKPRIDQGQIPLL
jgi:DNA polymerase-2